MTAPTFVTLELSLDDLDLDASPRVRLEDSADLVIELREAYERRATVPPPMVFRCAGKHLLADGRHRVKGAKAAGLAKLYCHVKDGSLEDCWRHALSSNATHGLRRTNADKRLCVEIALTKWASLSDHQVADMVHVSAPFVGTVRMALAGRRSIPAPTAVKGKDGKIYPRGNAFHLPPKPPQNQPISNPMPARKDPEGAINFPPEPEPVEMDRTEMAQHLQAAERCLLRFARGDGDPEHLMACLTEIRSVRGAIQMELPGMPLADKAGRRGTLKDVLAFCETKGLPASDGHWFFEKNEGCGWKVNGRAMANWKMTVSAWERAGIFPSQKLATAARAGKPVDPAATLRNFQGVLRAAEKSLKEGK